jgi:hypothetical protein
MAKRLAEILSERFDTGGPDAKKQKYYIRKIDRKFYGRFKWNSGSKSFKRAGGRYTDKREAENAAKVSAL